MIRCSRSDLRKTIFVVMLIVISLSFYCKADTRKTYGGTSVAKIVSTSGDFSFTCDVKGWPSIIGSDVKVIVKGIEPPGVITDNDAADSFYRQQVKEFIKDALSGAKAIELKNIERAKVFALEADVIVDGRNLARQLVDEGLAKVKAKKAIVKSVSKIAKSDGSLVASKGGKVFHKSTCSFVKRISEGNLITFTDKANAESSGRRPCKTCKP